VTKMRNGTREARRGVGVARGAKLADGYGEASENKEADKRLSDYRQYRGCTAARELDSALMLIRPPV
jgi:hypothetical protein